MKYVLLLLFVVSSTISPALAADKPVAAPQVNAESAVLVDAVTGQVLYEKNARVKRPMASTTKIMTAILVIENAGMNDVVTASKRASEVPYTSLHLKPGEKVKVIDLLRALMIRSANDSAVALAEHVGGSVEGFVKMMNQRAKELGAYDTKFANPNGLYAPGHYSTAHDLAIFTRHALRYEVFNQIVSTTSVRIERSINKQDVLVKTSSRFIKNYEGADGVKTGYIKQAGYCFVGSATRGGWRLLSVVLKSPDSQVDTTALMDYGFRNFERVILGTPEKSVTRVPVRGGKMELEVVPSRVLHAAVKSGDRNSVRTDVNIDREIYAPVKKGDKIGTITAYVNDTPVATVDLKAASDVEQTMISTTWPWIRTVTLLAMISIGVAGGRAAAKGTGGGRRRLS